MADVFISYSRLDKDFVGKLREALTTKEQEVWIDWESIPPSQAWWSEIQKGIARANNFVVVLSPNSMASPICHMEIEYARILGKRIIPVFHKPFGREDAIKAIAIRLANPDQDSVRTIWGTRQPHNLYDENAHHINPINYFFFQPDDDFDECLTALLEIIRTDFRHKEHHTTLELRALEWDRRNRNPSFLLLDDELAEVEKWLSDSTGKKPEPTDLQRDYIISSVKRTRELRNIRRARLISIFAASVAVLVAFGASLVSINTTQQLAIVPPTLTHVAEVVTTGEARATELEAQRLAALSEQQLLNLGGDTETSTLLAIRSLNLSDNLQSRIALQDALRQPRYSLAVLRGHRGTVLGAITLSSLNILSWSDDNTLRIWTDEGFLLATLEGHTATVNGAIELSNGHIVSYSDDHTLRVWTTDGQHISTLTGHTDRVTGAIELQDGGILSWSSGAFFGTSDDHNLLLWDTNGTLQAVFEGHQSDIGGASILRDGQIISWSRDMTLRLWSRSGTQISVLQGHTDTVVGAMELLDGTILSWSLDATLRIWDRVGNLIRTLQGHTDAIYGVLRLSDGRVLSWSNDHTLRVWNMLDGQAQILAGHTGWVVGALELEGTRILSWSNDDTLRIWDTISQQSFVLSGHGAPVTGAQILSDGRILSWSSDHRLRLWSSTGQPLATLAGHSDVIAGVLMIDSTRLLSWTGSRISGSTDHTLRIWSTSPVEQLVLEGHSDSISGAIELRDGRILSWSRDNTLRLWPSNGNSIVVLQGHDSWVDGAIELHDGRILSWASDNTLHLWDAFGNPLGILVGHTNHISGARELDNGQILSWTGDLATLGNPSTREVKLWDRDGSYIGEISNSIVDMRNRPTNYYFTQESSNSLRIWSIDGQLIQTAEAIPGVPTRVVRLQTEALLIFYGDNRVSRWDVRTRQLNSFEGGVFSLTELSDGRYLTSTGYSTLMLWTPNGELLATLEQDNTIYGVRELSRGRIVTWGTPSTLLYLWDNSGHLINTMDTEVERSRVVETDDERIVSSSKNGTFMVWDMDGNLQQILTGHHGLIGTTLPLSGGTFLTWTNSGGSILYDFSPRLWRDNGILISLFNGHTGEISGALELRNSRIITWSQDNTLRIWYADRDNAITFACSLVYRDFTFAERVLFQIDDTPTCPALDTP